MDSKFSRRGFLRSSLFATAAGLIAEKQAKAQEEAPADEVAATAERTPALERVPVEATVNGSEANLEVGPDDAALDIVREKLGLTGAKRGCGHGACGACTLHVDGAAVASCLLPATALHGKTVTTVEGLGARLHPVQRAFLAHDALQCGYCTPGFVMRSVAFYDEWRALNGSTEPSREQVAEALSGNLCRCAAYASIYAAVQAACAGAFEEDDPEHARYDGVPKVTGKARYTTDVRYGGLLEGRALRSPYASGTITALDVSPALKVEGVQAAIALAGVGSAVRYVGQEIAAVAATSREAAAAGLAAIQISYDVGSPVIGMDAALMDGAPLVFADRKAKKEIPSAAEGPLMAASLNGNLRGPFSSSMFSAPDRGEQIVAEARVEKKGELVEGTWGTQVVCHTTLEPHACVARWEGSDKLTVHASTQSVSALADDIADHYRLKRKNVQVLSAYVGGGFGSKVGLQMEIKLAVELAKEANAPVRFVLDRAEDIMIGGNRPASRMELAIASREGALSGLQLNAWSDSGVSAGNVIGMLQRIIYPAAEKSLNDYDVLNNAPPARPFRGPGGPQAYWSLEQAVDQMAELRGEGPIDIRRRWDQNEVRQRLYTWAEELPEWQARTAPGEKSGRYRRGIGLASGAWFYFVEPRSQVQVETTREGDLIISTASQDMGNGTRSMLAHAASEYLGMSRDRIEVKLGDSSYVRGPLSGGSRTTASLVPTLEDALEQMLDDLKSAGSRVLGLSGARIAKGGVEHSGGFTSWSQIMKSTDPQTYVGRRRPDEEGYFLPFAVDGIKIGFGIASCVQVTEVLVDTRLGKIRVEKVWAGFGVGRVVAPRIARSQAEGGILQGLSMALYEERRLDPQTGRLLTAGLEDYKLLGIGDAPPIDIHFDEAGFEQVRGGAIGIGEVCTVAAPASLGNAVYNATGWRPYDLPLRPDRVIAGVRA